MEGHTFLHWEIITKLQTFTKFKDLLAPPEQLDQFHNKYNHDFAQMYSLI